MFCWLRGAGRKTGSVIPRKDVDQDGMRVNGGRLGTRTPDLSRVKGTL